MHSPLKMMLIALVLLSLFLSPFGCGQNHRNGKRTVTSEGGEKVAAEKWKQLRMIEGHNVYVSAYSHIYHEDSKNFYLTNTLSIRNTDVHESIYIDSVTYHDTNGKLVREYVPQPLRIPPLGTLEYIVGARDTSGGSGANFLVHWQSTVKVSTPLIECVMISTASQQGLSFRTVGVPID